MDRRMLASRHLASLAAATAAVLLLSVVPLQVQASPQNANSASAAHQAVDVIPTPPPDETVAPAGIPSDQEIEIKRGDRTRKVRQLPRVRTADGKEAAPNRVIVGFKDALAEAERDEVHRAVGVNRAAGQRILKRVGPDAQVVEVGAGTRIEDVLKAYRADPRVRYAEPDYLAHADEAGVVTAQEAPEVSAQWTPNDPLFPDQWGMRKIEVPGAWDVTRGLTSINVAVLDTGIYELWSTAYGPGHRDLNGKVVKRQNFTDSFDLDDWVNHGTHVAGIASALTGNAVGVAGVGCHVRLFNVKVLDDTGSGYWSWIADGIYWAANNGAHVINLSLGGDSYSQLAQDAVNYAWSRNVAVVASAGNYGSNELHYPAAMDHVLAVAATDGADERAYFSNWGTWVDAAAPGVEILSTDYVGGYVKLGGTSMAAPHLSGLAALVRSLNWGAKAQYVVDRINITADRVPGTGTLWTAGRINARNAVQPPLEATGWGLTPTSAYSGEKVTARFRLRNTGIEPIFLQAVGASVWLGGDWKSGANDFSYAGNVTLLPGQEKEIQYEKTRSFLTPGDYYAMPRVKINSQWFPVPGGNRIDFTVKPIPPGRLVVDKPLTISNTSPYLGEAVTACFTLKNVGGKPFVIQAAAAHVWWGGEWKAGINDFPYVGSVTLAPGQEYPYCKNRSFSTLGDYHVEPRVKINSVWVPIEGGNRVNLTVTPPMLRALEWTLSSTSPRKGEWVTASFVVTNEGPSAITIQELAAAARQVTSYGEPVVDFPHIYGITLPPGGTYSYQQKRQYWGVGNYYTEPRAKVNNVWFPIPGGYRTRFSVTP